MRLSLPRPYRVTRYKAYESSLSTNPKVSNSPMSSSPSVTGNSNSRETSSGFHHHRHLLRHPRRQSILLPPKSSPSHSSLSTTAPSNSSALSTSQPTITSIFRTLSTISTSYTLLSPGPHAHLQFLVSAMPLHRHVPRLSNKSFPNSKKRSPIRHSPDSLQNPIPYSSPLRQTILLPPSCLNPVASGNPITSFLLPRQHQIRSPSPLPP